MMRNSIKKITNIFRVILLVIAVFAIAISLLWIYGKPSVDKFELGLVNSYMAYFQTELDKCRKQLDADSLKGIVSLEAFLGKIEEIKKRDRLDPIKRQAFELIVSSLRDAGDNEGALVWVERWIAFDDRDLYAQVRHVAIMMDIPSLYEAGVNKIETLYQKVPDARFISEKYANVLLEKMQYADAFLAIEKSINSSEALYRKKWEVFWDTGKSFNAVQRTRILPNYGADKTLSLMIHLEPGVRKIRIDAPPSLPLIISNPRLVKTASGPKNSLNIAEIPLGFHQVVQNGNKLHTFGGNDPFFFWDMPDLLIEKEPSTWVFTASVNEAFPEEFNILFDPDIAKLVKSELLSRGDTAAFQKFILMFEQQYIEGLNLNEDLGTLQGIDGHLELFWRPAHGLFSEERKTSVRLHGVRNSEGFSFTHQFVLNANVTQLRFDFPEVQKVEYLLDSIELFNNGHATHQIPLESMVPANRHNVENKGRVFRVVGEDPHFSFDVPNGFEEITSVRIKGVVR